jgi:hypothetical protein
MHVGEESPGSAVIVAAAVYIEHWLFGGIDKALSASPEELIGWADTLLPVACHLVTTHRNKLLLMFNLRPTSFASASWIPCRAISVSDHLLQSPLAQCMF